MSWEPGCIRQHQKLASPGQQIHWRKPFLGVCLFSCDLRRAPAGRVLFCFLCKSQGNKYTSKMGIHQRICCPGGANLGQWCIHPGPLINSTSSTPRPHAQRETKQTRLLRQANRHTPTIVGDSTSSDTRHRQILNFLILVHKPNKDTNQVRDD
jgi:hypothetical protein